MRIEQDPDDEQPLTEDELFEEIYSALDEARAAPGDINGVAEPSG